MTVAVSYPSKWSALLNRLAAFASIRRGPKGRSPWDRLEMFLGPGKAAAGSTGTRQYEIELVSGRIEEGPWPDRDDKERMADDCAAP